MTFKEYLACCKPGYDHAGDFVRLARADAEMPEIATEAELLAYIRSTPASSWTIDAARDVWQHYQERLRKAQKA